MIPLLFAEKKLKIPDLNKKYANTSGNRKETQQYQKTLLFAEKNMKMAVNNFTESNERLQAIQNFRIFEKKT